MAVTRIADVIVPSVFNPYVVQRTMELDALVQSGIVVNNPQFDALAAAGGKLINMPFFNDLGGADEVLSDTTALTAGNITSSQDVAVLLMRGRAWGVNDLSKALSGDDPMKAIADLVGTYWSRRRQATLVSILKGIFASSGMAGNLHDISGLTAGAELIKADTVVDAAQKLGDAKENLTAMVMHSTVESYLAKQQFITYESTAGKTDKVPMYLGRRVIVDDGSPYNSGTKVATTYLFGPGAIALGNGGAPVPTETDRDSLAGNDYLMNRQHFLLHPRGVAFQNAAVAGSSPTNTELEGATNWTRVFENKAIRIVAFTHKIA